MVVFLNAGDQHGMFIRIEDIFTFALGFFISPVNVNSETFINLNFKDCT
jgi:hypothetical protein